MRIGGGGLTPTESRKVLPVKEPDQYRLPGGQAHGEPPHSMNVVAQARRSPDAKRKDTAAISLGHPADASDRLPALLSASPAGLGADPAVLDVELSALGGARFADLGAEATVLA